MAKQNRTTLKTYFNTGDIPVESNYVDLIDSNLNLSENNTGDINLTGNITASGEISASGDIITDVLNIGGPAATDKALYRAASDNALSIGFPTYDIDMYGTAVNIDSNVILPSPHTLDVGSHITASGNISASGIVYGSQGRFPSRIITSEIYTFTSGQDIAIADSINVNGNITASGDISSSATLIANEANIIGNITASGNISASGNITAQHITASGDISASGNITADTLISNNITASGNISASGVIISDKYEFGYGSAQAYLQATDNASLLSKFGSNKFEGDITASGNISASGRVFATHLKLNQDGVGNGQESSIYFGSTTSAGGKIYDDTNGFVMSYNDTDVLKAGETTTEITNTLKVYGGGGDVMIGANAEPGEKLEVVGNISASGTITSQTAAASFNYNLNHSTNTAIFAFSDGGYDLGGSFGRESVILTITGMPAKSADGVIGELIFLNRVIPQGTVILTTTNSNVVAIPFEQTSTQFKLGFKASPTMDFDGGSVVVSITYLMPS